MAMHTDNPSRSVVTWNTEAMHKVGSYRCIINECRRPKKRTATDQFKSNTFLDYSFTGVAGQLQRIQCRAIFRYPCWKADLLGRRKRGHQHCGSIHNGWSKGGQGSHWGSQMKSGQSYHRIGTSPSLIVTKAQVGEVTNNGKWFAVNTQQARILSFMFTNLRAWVLKIGPSHNLENSNLGPCVTTFCGSSG